MTMERRHHGIEISLVTNLRVKRVIIGDVIAVGTASSCPQVRRGVDVTDAKLGKIGNQLLGLPEGKVLMELQAIGTRQSAAAANRHGSAFRLPPTLTSCAPRSSAMARAKACSRLSVFSA